MTIDNATLEHLARRLLADYDAAKPLSIFTEGLRLQLPDAWRLQNAVTGLREERGETVVGYKVGAVTPHNQKMMGLPHPVWGRLWASELHDSGVALSKNNYTNLSIEAEFGIVLCRNLVPGMSIAEIAASVDAVYPTLELHNLCLQSAPPHGHELIANNCINCGVVRGAAHHPPAPCDTDLKLLYDGRVIDKWPQLRWPDDILAAVVWLTDALYKHGLNLRTGDFILTSAWGPPVPVNNHTRIEVSSSEFGSAFATLD